MWAAVEYGCHHNNLRTFECQLHRRHVKYVPAIPADRIHYQVKMCKDSHIDLGFHSTEAEEEIVSMQQSKAENKIYRKKISIGA